MINESISNLLESFSDDQVHIDISNEGSVIELENMKNKFKFNIIFSQDESNIILEKYDDKINNRMLHNILSKFNYNNINQVIEMIEQIKNIVMDITNYCTGCYEKLEFQSEEFITCGKEECNYKSEEQQFGNPIIEKTNQDRNMVEFLLKSGIDAIKCARKYDIFEPFPHHFINNVNHIHTFWKSLINIHIVFLIFSF